MCFIVVKLIIWIDHMARNQGGDYLFKKLQKKTLLAS
jgi:hypothetical protein